MIKREDVFKIGTLGKTHGLKGELVFHFTDDIFDRCDEVDYIICNMEGILVPFFIEEYRFRSDEQALIKLEDIDTEERAKDMVGIEVFFPKEYVEEDAPLSWNFFIDMTIEDVEGRQIGTIKDVDQQTENVLFIVESADKEFMIPAIEDFIVEIDEKEGTIVMNIPQGLIELNDED